MKNELLNKIEAYKKKENPLKAEYIAFIKDKTFPLADRWEVYKAAPEEFQDHQSWIVHFEAEKLLPSGRISWYDDFYVEKYSEVCVSDLIDEQMAEKVEDDEGVVWTPEILDAFREEVLQKNLGSFTFDW